MVQEQQVMALFLQIFNYLVLNNSLLQSFIIIVRDSLYLKKEERVLPSIHQHDDYSLLDTRTDD